MNIKGTKKKYILVLFCENDENNNLKKIGFTYESEIYLKIVTIFVCICSGHLFKIHKNKKKTEGKDDKI